MDNAKIYGFSGGGGLEPKIVLEVPCSDTNGRREFNYSEIDEAIRLFISLVFREKNIAYKLSESIRELSESYIDIDNESDFIKVMKLRNQKIKECQIVQ